jgi:hypothetical protein
MHTHLLTYLHNTYLITYLHAYLRTYIILNYLHNTYFITYLITFFLTHSMEKSRAIPLVIKERKELKA